MLLTPTCLYRVSLLLLAMLPLAGDFPLDLDLDLTDDLDDLDPLLALADLRLPKLSGTEAADARVCELMVPSSPENLKVLCTSSLPRSMTRTWHLNRSGPKLDSFPLFTIKDQCKKVGFFY